MIRISAITVDFYLEEINWGSIKFCISLMIVDWISDGKASHSKDREKILDASLLMY
ncbi:MAG: hypothetical protein ACR5KW_02205 [Wolbachia sp.]